MLAVVEYTKIMTLEDYAHHQCRNTYRLWLLGNSGTSLKHTVFMSLKPVAMETHTRYVMITLLLKSTTMYVVSEYK